MPNKEDARQILVNVHSVIVKDDGQGQVKLKSQPEVNIQMNAQNL